MSRRESNYLQSRLFIGDLHEGNYKVSSNPFSIHRMEYDVSRRHDANGEPFGSTSSTMNLTIALGERSNARLFLEKMNESEPSAFSIVFGGDVEDGVLTNFRNLIVFWAYVVKAEESFTVIDEDKSNTFLNIRMLLHEINYVGKENNTVKVLEIRH
ncbi:MAG: hypothetical protein MJY69_07575 [Bacteroidales bacterium]|nr:hypothetical protein [Bacteroidales bacterium]